MADVAISLVDNGDLTADIVVTATGADLNGAGDSMVAGIALDVSVDAGTIVDVVAAKEGISTDGAEGYGIFMGTITFTGGDPEEIAGFGTPVAPASAPDAPGQLGSSAIVLELGALYDVAVGADAPLAVTELCTITVSEGCIVTLAANGTRGGVVLIGGGDPSALSIVGGPIGPGGPAKSACFPKGDANGDCTITFSDVQVVIAAWPPNAYDEMADFNVDGAITFSDVQILIASWPPNPGCDVSCVPVP
jgi:hypothetical protein